MIYKAPYSEIKHCPPPPSLNFQGHFLTHTIALPTLFTSSWPSSVCRRDPPPRYHVLCGRRKPYLQPRRRAPSVCPRPSAHVAASAQYLGSAQGRPAVGTYRRVRGRKEGRRRRRRRRSIYFKLERDSLDVCVSVCMYDVCPLHHTQMYSGR